MRLYCICFREPDLPTNENVWVEFYWADDAEHAQEQAEDSHPGTPQVATAVVPDVYTRQPS